MNQQNFSNFPPAYVLEGVREDDTAGIFIALPPVPPGYCYFADQDSHGGDQFSVYIIPVGVTLNSRGSPIATTEQGAEYVGFYGYSESAFQGMGAQPAPQQSSFLPRQQSFGQSPQSSFPPPQQPSAQPLSDDWVGDGRDMTSLEMASEYRDLIGEHPLEADRREELLLLKKRKPRQLGRCGERATGEKRADEEALSDSQDGPPPASSPNAWFK